MNNILNAPWRTYTNIRFHTSDTQIFLVGLNTKIILILILKHITAGFGKRTKRGVTINILTTCSSNRSEELVVVFAQWTRLEN